MQEITDPVNGVEPHALGLSASEDGQVGFCDVYQAAQFLGRHSPLFQYVFKAYFYCQKSFPFLIANLHRPGPLRSLLIQSGYHLYISIRLNKQVIILFQPLHFPYILCKQQHCQHKGQGKYRDRHHILKLIKAALEKQL